MSRLRALFSLFLDFGVNLGFLATAGILFLVSITYGFHPDGTIMIVFFDVLIIFSATCLAAVPWIVRLRCSHGRTGRKTGVSPAHRAKRVRR
jgi:hypothetical protein